jgi:hypothetical protein
VRKLLTVFILGTAVLILQNCSGTKKAAAAKPASAPVPVAVTPVPVPVAPTPAVAVPAAYTYKKNVAPIILASCAPCHFPPDGRKEPLNTYAAVKNQIGEIISRVKLPQTDGHFMPFRLKKPALSNDAINVLVQWQKQNMAE